MGTPADNHKSQNKLTYYIGIGASAGGLEAIESFFSNMSPNSGFAFIVIQHLSPDYKSMMKELLSKKTEMTIYRAEDGMQVAPNSVYLIPPKKNLTIFHGKLMLDEQDHTRGINLPIDVFLKSLAEDQGEKAIGIILSGTGSDGMRGVRAIKESGGMVMVQSETSAKFDGMPRAAISTGLADFILPPNEMPRQIIAFVEHPYVSKAEHSKPLSADEDAMMRVFSILRERCKIDFTHYKQSTVGRRIERRMTVNQIQDLRDYVAYLQSTPAEVMTLYRELLIGVTNFFRDPPVWQELAREWMPQLLKRASGREIRFWVAGCATGEEAYTLAILTRECMHELGLSRDIKIFATDIDREAIVHAGAGIYPNNIAADLSPQLLGKYFYRRDDHFQIARNIRETVVFAQHNIIRDPPFTNIDLVSCRNLLIYLQPILQKRVLELFTFSLNTSGVLILGTSETTGEVAERFDLLNQKQKIYRCKGDRRHMVTANVVGEERRGQNQTTESRYAAGRRSFRPSEADRLMDRFMGLLAESYVPLALIVTEQMEVLHVLGDTEGYFKLPSGKVHNDISKMAAKDLAIPLSTGIQKVFRTGREVTYTNIRLKHLEQSRAIKMQIRPMPERKGEEPLVVVFLEEITTHHAQSDTEVKSYDIGEDAEQRIRDLEQDLQFTQENLQATIEELETSNEELQATNEELLASNEELQSTNEELQSTNEELYTVNAEYQSKILELTELNNDVENLLSSSLIGQLLLDEDLIIRKFSPEITRIFKIIESDVGRPIFHISHTLRDVDPVWVARRVLESSESVEKEVQAHDDRWYLMRVVPYCIGPASFSGAVMVFVDITQSKQNLAALMESEKALREMARVARIGSWALNPETGRHHWGGEVFRIFGLATNETPPVADMIAGFAPEDRTRVSEALRRATDDGKPFDITAEITVEDGQRWVRFIGRPQLSGGRVTMVSGIIQEITAIKMAERRLADSRKDVTELIHFMPSGLFIYEQDGDGRLILVDGNQEAQKLTGLRIESWIGRPFGDIWPGTAGTGLETRLQHVIDTGETLTEDAYAYTDDRLSGIFRVIAFRLTGRRLAVGFENITAHRQTAELFEKSEARYRFLFERMRQGVVYQDREGKITDANPAAERILRLSRDQMLGRDSIDPRWQAIRRDGEPFPGEEHPAMVALKSGKPVLGVTMGVRGPENDTPGWIEIDAYPIFGKSDSDRPEAVFTMFREIE